MASRAERGECSALHDGVVGAHRAGALQAQRVEKTNKKNITPHFVWKRVRRPKGKATPS